VSDTLAAVLTREPDWARLPDETPPNVVRLLRRCFSKDIRTRLHHIADARIEMDDIDVAPQTPASAPRYRNLAIVLGLGLVAAATLLLSLWNSGPFSGSSSVSRNPLADASFTRVTDFEGSEYDASISRDGRFVTFISDRDGPFDVFVSQIGTNHFRNLTNNSEQVNYVKEVRRTGFNAEGSEIWLGGGLGRRMRSVPLLGGAVRNFLGEEAVNVDWSPDGQRTVYHNKSPGDPVFVADRDGSNPCEILKPPAGTHQLRRWRWTSGGFDPTVPIWNA
jgi:Tol biopolymer transport system component